MEDINQIYVPEMGINQVLSQEDIIKEITPENFKDYSNSQLISLIEKNNSMSIWTCSLTFMSNEHVHIDTNKNLAEGNWNYEIAL